MRAAWLVIGIFLARFVTEAVAFPPSDGDLAWQQFLGNDIVALHAIPRALGPQTFSAAGAPWTPQEWAFSLGVAFAKSGGLAWVVFASIVALAAVLTLVLVAWTCVRLGATPLWTAVAVAAVGVALDQSFGVRAQVAAWPFVAALLLLLRFRDRRIFGVVLLTALWSNVHASVVLAPVVVALVAVGTLVDERRFTAEVGRLSAAAAGSLVATCANPFGAGLPLYAVRLFGDTTVRAYITEWQPTRLDDTSFTYGALPLLLAIGFVGLGTRSSWRNVLILAAFAFLMFGAERNIAIFAIAAAPLVASAVAARFAALPRHGEPVPEAPSTTATPIGSRPPWIRVVGAPVAALAVVLLVSASLSSRAASATDPGLVGASQALAKTTHRNLLCEDFSWCSAFLANGERDYLDGRADPFPDDVWQDYGTILRLKPGWQDVLRRRNVEAVLTHRGGALSQALTHHGWHSIYRDERYDVLTESSRIAAADLAKRSLLEITKVKVQTSGYRQSHNRAL